MNDHCEEGLADVSALLREVKTVVIGLRVPAAADVRHVSGGAFDGQGVAFAFASEAVSFTLQKRELLEVDAAAELALSPMGAQLPDLLLNCP
jgi:hypothetical protein